jgi:hypothetical protein
VSSPGEAIVDDDTYSMRQTLLIFASLVRTCDGSGESSVAVPFADRWLDIDHDLLTIAGDCDAMQIAVQECDEFLGGHGTVLHLHAVAGERALHRGDAGVFQQHLPHGLEAHRTVRPWKLDLCPHLYLPHLIGRPGKG